MEFKKYEELTKADMEQIIKEGRKLMRDCSGKHCSDCIVCPNNYGLLHLNCAGFLEKVEDEIKLKEEGTKDWGPYSYTDYKFTPENTTLEYLLENDLLQKLAAMFEDDTSRGKMCDGTSCSKCTIHQNNFSKEWKHDVCSSVREEIIQTAKAIKKYEELRITKPKVITGVCKTCKHRKQQGDYIFCEAWKNFTQDCMTCGYYLTAEKECDIIQE